MRFAPLSASILFWALASSPWIFGASSSRVLAETASGAKSRNSDPKKAAGRNNSVETDLDKAAPFTVETLPPPERPPGESSAKLDPNAQSSAGIGIKIPFLGGPKEIDPEVIKDREKARNIANKRQAAEKRGEVIPEDAGPN